MRILLLASLLLPLPALAAEPTKLTLEQAFDAAQKSSPDLAAAAERVEQANDDARAALAAVLPQVKAEGFYLAYSEEFFFPGFGLLIQPSPDYAGTVTATWPLINPAAFPALAAAKHGAKVTAAVQGQARQELLYATAQAWWALVATDNLVKAANEGVANTTELARVAGEQVRAQVATRLASVRAQSEVERARQLWIGARGARGSAEAALSRLTGLPTPLDTVTPPPVDTSGTLLAEETLWEKARGQRPDLVAAAETLAARRALEQGWYTGYLPVIAGKVERFYVNNTLFTGGVHDYWNWGLVASWNLYDGGLREAHDAKARSQWREAMDQEESTLRKARQEVAQAALDLATARASLDAARQGSTLAREAQTLAKSQYSAGTATNLEVTEANAALFQAEASLAQAEAQAALADLALKKATGEPLH